MRTGVMLAGSVLVISMTLASLCSVYGQVPQPDAGGKPGVTETAKKQPRSDNLHVAVAACIGAGGSTVYLIAVYLGFVARDGDGRRKLLQQFLLEREPAILPFLQFLHVLVFSLLYIGGGGFVAYIFQLPQATLAPVQAFIIGCTWPAIVSNYLSARQSGADDAELAARSRQIKDQVDKAKDAKILQDYLKQSSQQVEDDKKRLEELKQILG